MLALAWVSAKPAQKCSVSNAGAAACTPPDSISAMTRIDNRIMPALIQRRPFQCISRAFEKLRQIV
jgi:hypothetical protein